MVKDDIEKQTEDLIKKVLEKDDDRRDSQPFSFTSL
jgi:hypothetical protein